ncbi:hypothetical protein BD560DRAFT_407830 [Blakeslea trispora]|nr:hypothetical protein BD560DRAFT_407830 [Blakeslea trispora]
MRCHNCGSNKIESDGPSGTSFCVECGTVLEENTIVAEVTFGETSGGKAILQGSYAGESGRISGGGLFGRNRGREGQEQSIENGRVKISSLAHATRLPERYREAAQRYYNLAVVNRFTRGRRSDHVAAVCLYAVCRTEKSSHMLIDFSDILQVNVFTLGATFLKFCRVLNLTLPHVDPSLYISRFAAALDFGDYTHRVAQDAVRIAQRMDRDWITSGRRPAGICGACLLIAARMNGFRRTTREMIYVVKVSDVTIEKRLSEFNQTESAQLSVRDFRTIWLESRADPPSFTKNKKLAELEKKRKRAAIKGTDASESESESEEEENDQSEQASLDQNQVDDQPTASKELTEEEVEQQMIQKEIASSLNDQVRLMADVDTELTADASVDTSVSEKGKEKATQELEATQVATQSSEMEDTQATLVEQQESDYIPIKDADYNALPLEDRMKISAIARAKVAAEEQSLLNPELEEDVEEIAKEMDNWLGDNSMVEAAKQIEKEKHESDEEEEEEVDEGNLSDVDCEEIDAMILTEEEVAFKTKIWYNANKEYLEEMAVKRMIDKEKGHPVSRKNRHKKKKAYHPASTPAEAAKQLLANKKLSKKINQAVFDDMFESPESIAKLKARDAVEKMTGKSIPAPVTEYEVVEESGDADASAAKKKTDGTKSTTNGDQTTEEQGEDEEDDEEMDSDDMAEDERFLRDARANYAFDDDVGEDYGEDYGDDY